MVLTLIPSYFDCSIAIVSIFFILTPKTLGKYLYPTQPKTMIVVKIKIIVSIFLIFCDD